MVKLLHWKHPISTFFLWHYVHTGLNISMCTVNCFMKYQNFKKIIYIKYSLCLWEWKISAIVRDKTHLLINVIYFRIMGADKKDPMLLLELDSF